MACGDQCPVHAIYAADDVPPEFQGDIEFNATEGRRIQESGQGAIEVKKDLLPTAAENPVPILALVRNFSIKMLYVNHVYARSAGTRWSAPRCERLETCPQRD